MAVGASFNQSNPMWMHTHLILHPEYKMRFADRVYKYFFNGGLLTPEGATERFMARAEQIETAIIAESARWGDAKRSKPRTKDDDWMPDMQRMVDEYFPRRTGIVLNQFKAQGWYPSIEPPTFSQARRPPEFRRHDRAAGRDRHGLVHARRHGPADSRLDPGDRR